MVTDFLREAIRNVPGDWEQIEDRQQNIPTKGRGKRAISHLRKSELNSARGCIIRRLFNRLRQRARSAEVCADGRLQL